MASSVNRINSHNPITIGSRNSQAHTPAQRQPLANTSGNTVDRSGVNGYGMSAGMKVGRQQAGKISVVLLQLS